MCFSVVYFKIFSLMEWYYTKFTHLTYFAPLIVCTIYTAFLQNMKLHVRQSIM